MSVRCAGVEIRFLADQAVAPPLRRHSGETDHHHRILNIYFVRISQRNRRQVAAGNLQNRHVLAFADRIVPLQNLRGIRLAIRKVNVERRRGERNVRLQLLPHHFFLLFRQTLPVLLFHLPDNRSIVQRVLKFLSRARVKCRASVRIFQMRIGHHVAVRNNVAIRPVNKSGPGFPIGNLHRLQQSPRHSVLHHHQNHARLQFQRPLLVRRQLLSGSSEAPQHR